MPRVVTYLFWSVVALIAAFWLAPLIGVWIVISVVMYPWAFWVYVALAALIIYLLWRL